MKLHLAPCEKFLGLNYLYQALKNKSLTSFIFRDFPLELRYISYFPCTLT